MDIADGEYEKRSSELEEAGGNPVLELDWWDGYEASLFKEGTWPVETNPQLEAYAQDLARKANDIAMLLLQEPPELVFRLSAPDLLTHSPPFQWFAVDLDSGHKFPLSGLSEAQHRWSTFSIRVALAGPLDLVLIDEPERGLHRSAQRHLASGLQELSERVDAPVVVASHSPELLGRRQSRLMHVRRNSAGRIDTAKLSVPDFDHLAELGLDAVDALTLVRRFVIVEGDHDLEVLRILLGDELEHLQAHVIPMHGSTKLASTIDSQLMFDFTDAGVVVVLDNTSAKSALDLLAGAHQLIDGFADDDFDEAVLSWAKQARSGRTKEEKDLIEFYKSLLFKAHKSNRLDRVAAFGFEKADIVDYLDCASLVPNQSDWDELRERHGSHKGTPWKPWLTAEYGARFANEDIRAAAVAVANDTPNEFFDLVQVIQSVPRANGLDSDAS